MVNRILITGGAGFIGSHTVDALLREGKEVVVLDNLFSGKLENLDLSQPNLEFVEGDILEYHLIEDLLAGCDAVLHLAAISSVPQSIENPIYTFQVNTQGLLHVLEAVRHAHRQIKVVYASSASVYGEAKILPCDDTKPLTGKLLSPYALQKKQGEDFAALYSSLFGIEALGLRYFNVYGLRQVPDSPYSGVISRFLDYYRTEKPLTIFGDGTQSRDFIFIEDVVRANLLALNSHYSGVVNIATGVPETLLNMVRHIEHAGGRKAELRMESPRPGDIHASYATVNQAQETIGFQAKVALADGIATLVKPALVKPA